MVKIKTKKKLTLPELIQWGWDNGIENKEFYGSLRGCVHFSDYGWIGIDEWGLVKPDDNFEVEIEEEITEETVIPNLMEVYEYGGEIECASYENYSIKNALSDDDDDDSIAFYMLNDDMTMTLLWKRDKGK